MVPYHELVRTLERQPLLRMQRFAELLGWRGLQLDCIRDPKVEGGVFISYMTSDWKFNLQINTQPHGQMRFHAATVKAERYRFSGLPFQSFELFDDEGCLQKEADRLRPLLARRNFKTPAWRRRFAAEHPKLVLPVHRLYKGK